MSVILLNKNSFQKEVLEDEGLVLVDFYAEWCSPCKMLVPIIEELSVEYADRVKFTKLNIDDASDLAANYTVASIPTIILFQNGEKKETLIGVTPKGKLEDVLKKHL